MTSNSPSSLPPVVGESSAAPGQANAQPEKNPLLHNRGLILGLLFGVTAALGLPLLWYSPVFTRKEKWMWSAVVIIYTVILCLIAWAAFWFAWTALRQAQGAY